MNPLCYYFVQRYSSVEMLKNKYLNKVQDLKDICEKYHITNYSPKVVVKDGEPQMEKYPYAGMNIKITCIEKHGDWTTETITEETHGFHLEYFQKHLKMAVEDYMDVMSADIYGYIEFRVTFGHPLFNPLRLNISPELTVLVEVKRMFYVDPNMVKSLNLTLSPEHFSGNKLREPMRESNKKTISDLIAEYNPMQWYTSL